VVQRVIANPMKCVYNSAMLLQNLRRFGAKLLEFEQIVYKNYSQSQLPSSGMVANLELG